MRFPGSKKKTSISRYEWISTRAYCTRNLLRLFCEEKWCKESSLIWYLVNLWVSQTMLNHEQKLLLLVSDCFCLSRVCKSFWKEVGRVQIAHLHSWACGSLKSESVFLNCQQILRKSFLLFPLCWDAATIFTNGKRLLTSSVFL